MTIEPFHISFDRTLTSANVKENIPFSFQLPAGLTQLTIRLSFSPWLVNNIYNMLTLSVFDPQGWRGAGHRHGSVHEVVMNAQSATPGYRAGPIQAGEWSVVVDTHMIMPGPPCPIRLEITGTDVPLVGSAPTWVPGRATPRGRGWYRGDLHAHTIHSDASWDVPELLEWAREEKLDFSTLSDHNTVSNLAQMDASRTDRLLTIGGLELTTFWGHALVLGVRDWFDWRVRPGERTMEQIAANVTQHGGLFIIAHPRAVGDPLCTGCRWVYETMMPGNARAVEVWNDPWSSEGDNNEDALALAFDWLNQGYRIALTAGTDNHGRRHALAGESQAESYGFDVVYSEDLSEPEILKAVREGHLYLSSGPCLELTASTNGQSAMMGDVIHTVTAMPVTIDAQWDGAPAGARLALIVDGKTRETLALGERGSQTWQLTGDADHWCLVTLRSRDGLMLALTNPIYLDGRTM
jgi:hypothetical protein